MFKSVLTALVVILVCGIACQANSAGDGIAATADQVKPVRTGERAPEFVVRDADNTEFHFDPDSLERPDMLYASLAADTQEDIADLGYRIYSDADAQAAIALGIAFKASERTISGRVQKGQDIAESSMLTHGVLPVPAVYAVDTKGMIRFDFVEPDYKVRLPADELLAVARELAGNTQ